MPLTRPEEFGTEAAGERSRDYCAYGYQNGSFVAPKISMEQMRDFCVGKMVELNLMPKEAALKLMRETLPTLKRWIAAS